MQVIKEITHGTVPVHVARYSISKPRLASPNLPSPRSPPSSFPSSLLSHRTGLVFAGANAAFNEESLNLLLRIYMAMPSYCGIMCGLHESSLHLTVVGSVQIDEGTWDAAGLSHLLTRLGRVSSLAQVLGRARVGLSLMPYGTGISTKTITYLGHGLPVVANLFAVWGVQSPVSITSAMDSLAAWHASDNFEHVRSNCEALVPLGSSFSPERLEQARATGIFLVESAWQALEAIHLMNVDDELWRKMSSSAISTASRYTAEGLMDDVEQILNSVGNVDE